jgi:hypothetical protein
MKVRIGNLSRLAGVIALGAGLMGFAGCGGDDLKDAACADYDVECASKGVVDGNFAISGNVAIDSFFKSVVNFGNTAGEVAADIKAEVDGIQLAFGVSDADVKAAGSVGAAIQAKLDADFKASIVVDAQPAKCEVDAQITAQATLDCQASANCDVSGGKAEVTCMGTCTVEASAQGTCDAMAELTCEVSGPELACSGECSGSCEVAITGGATCEGQCNGTCSGKCSAAGDANHDGVVAEGECTGTCDAGCQGKCEVGGMAAVNCAGTCKGSCTAKAPEAGCTGGAKATCEFKAEAMAKCSGSCDGEFEPPKVECDASASCEASAKADAKFSAKCTPPSIEVKVTVGADVTAEAKAQLDFAISELKVRLPRLLAAVKKADVVVDAGTELTSTGKTAVNGTIEALSDIKSAADISAAVKIGKCVPAQLDASANVITTSGDKLAGQVSAAASLTSVFGMK